MPKQDISKVGSGEEKIKPMTPNAFIYKFPKNQSHCANQGHRET